jgi:hypothetical protein
VGGRKEERKDDGERERSEGSDWVDPRPTSSAQNVVGKCLLWEQCVAEGGRHEVLVRCLLEWSSRYSSQYAHKTLSLSLSPSTLSPFDHHQIRRTRCWSHLFLRIWVCFFLELQGRDNFLGVCLSVWSQDWLIRIGRHGKGSGIWKPLDDSKEQEQ